MLRKLTCQMSISRIAVLLVLLFSPSLAHAQNNGSCLTATCSATDCSRNNVLAALPAPTNTNSTVTVTVPSCSTTSWTSNITYSVPSSVTSLTVEGATTCTGSGDPNGGTMGVVTCTDGTIIQDNDTADTNQLFELSSATGSIRFTRITIEKGTAAAKNNAELVISATGCGNPAGCIRIDHNHFNSNTEVTQTGGESNLIQIGSCSRGVADHNFFQNDNGVSGFEITPYNGIGCNGNPYVDDTWAAATNFGSGDFFFIEQNYSTDGSSSGATQFNDCTYGGKNAIRFNTFTNGSHIETHPTGSGGFSGNNRGCRATEYYGNQLLYTLGDSGPIVQTVFFFSSGAGILWGNSVTQSTSNKSGYSTFIGLHNCRQSAEGCGYAIAPVPGNYGFSGPVPIGTGTITCAANSTSCTGTNFSTSWPGSKSRALWITGATCQSPAGGLNGTSPSCDVSSVASSTALTLGHASSAALTSAPYTAGSPWDGNTNAYGYPGLDMATRGQSDLLTGEVAPLWTPSTFYCNGSLLTDSVTSLHIQKSSGGTGSNGSCTGGTSGSGSQPSFSTSGGSVSDGTVTTWTDQGQIARRDSVTNTITWPNQKQVPLYIFLNKWHDLCCGNGPTGLAAMVAPWDSSSMWAQNSDYYVSADLDSGTDCTGFTGNPINGGVGCGTLALRPSCNSGCTAGVAYWAQDQGDWNTSGYGFGQGTLYIFNGSSWTTYYTPYTYPHPLASQICGDINQSLTDSNNQNWAFASPCVTGTDASGYTPVSVQYWVGNASSTTFDLGIYADNSGSPGSLLCHTGSTMITPSDGWNNISLSGKCSTLAANTRYWIGYITGSSTIQQGTVRATCPGTSLNSVYAGTQESSSVLPSPFGSTASTPYCYSIYLVLNEN